MVTNEYDLKVRIWGEGWDAAVAWLWPQVQRLEAECDRLYLRAFNPAERAQIIQQRLDKHFHDEWERFISTPDPVEPHEQEVT